MAGWVNAPTVLLGSDADDFAAEAAKAGAALFKGVFFRAPTDATSEGVLVRENRTLAPGWRDVLARWAVDAALTARVANGTAAGVFLGDEICCGRFDCVTDVLAPLAQAVREELGDGPLVYVRAARIFCGRVAAPPRLPRGHSVETSITRRYTNECSGTFQVGKTPMMPEELDLVGFDMSSGRGVNRSGQRRRLLMRPRRG